MSVSREVDALIGAIRFFTRLSLPGPHGHSSASLERAMRYFPVAGLVVGLLAALTYTLAALFWPKTLAVLAAIALAILLTGALHEDGWCDTVDGFGGSTSRERVLEIMRDSSVGSYGALGLAVLLFGRFFVLLEIDAAWVAPALVAGHAVSRLCATVVMARLEYVRALGKASPFIHRLTSGDLVLAGLPALLPCWWLPRASALAGLVLAGLATLWLARLCKRRLGGYTGDCLGATQQAAELAFYLGLLVRVG